MTLSPIRAASAFFRRGPPSANRGESHLTPYAAELSLAHWGSRLPVPCLLLAFTACGAPHRPPPPPEFFKPPDLPASNPRAVQLRGRVLDPSGKPVANVPVLVIGGGHCGERPVTNAAGEFQVAGLPSTLDGYVAVHVPGYAALVREPVRIVERNSESVTLRLAPERTVEGVVTDPDGNPLANARVEARGERRLKTPIRKGASWEEVLQIDTVRTDPEGRFRFAGLNPGEVELVAHWPRALEAVGAARVQAGERAARVRIDPKENDQVLFTGRVLDATTRTPIAGAEVSASSAGEGDAPPLSQRATTDATGAFVLGPFPPSLFHLEASHRFPGARRATTWKLAGARDPGLHRLEIKLTPEPN